MAVEFLVKARARKIFNIGAISQTVKEAPAVWGRMETLPDFIQVRVTDATKADIDKYNRVWTEVVEVIENDDHFRVQHIDRTSPNRPKLTAAKRTRFKGLLKAHGVTNENVVIENGGLLIDKVLTFEELQGAVNDALSDMHKHRQYHINPTVINNFVSQGKAFVEITLAQLESNLVNGAD